MANRWIDPEEIRRAIELLKPNGEIFECRVAHYTGKIYAGYFRGPDKLIEVLSRTDLSGCNVYFTLQKIMDELEARIQWETLLLATKDSLTKDKNAIAYNYLPIDVDPVRISGISSSEKELETALRVQEMAIDYMTENGYNSRVEAFSGNGYHVLFRLPEDLRAMPVTEVSEIIHETLNELNELCGTPAAKIDLTNHNPSRVFKLYGTLAQKGRSTKDRPHRMARIEKVVDW